MDNITAGPFMQDVSTGMAEVIVEIAPPLLRTNPTMAVPYVILVGIALSFGTAGNLLIIGTYLFCKNIRGIGNEFILNLAVADFCVTAIADPMCILGVTQGEQYFVGRMWLCELIACLCLTACLCAFLSLSMVTLNRYIYLCHNGIYHKIYRKYTILFMCILIWIFSIAFEMPNFIGWGKHFFDKKAHQCIWSRKESLSYTMFMAFVLLCGPLIFMLIAYVRIFLKIKKTKQKVVAHSSNELSMSELKKKEWKETLKSSKTLFIVLIAFFVCWTPYIVVIAIDFADRLPFYVHLWVTFLAHMHSSVNVFIYGFTNQNFREGYKRVLHYDVWWKRSSSQPTNSTGTLTDKSDPKPQNKSPKRVDVQAAPDSSKSSPPLESRSAYYP